MKVSYRPGADMFEDADEHVIVNPANSHGVLGGGVAALVREKLPHEVAPYERACRDGALIAGSARCLIPGRPEGPVVIHAVTMGDFGDRSSVSLVRRAFRDVMEEYRDLLVGEWVFGRRPVELRVPMLGCGIGGLEWGRVLPALLLECDPLVTGHVVFYGPEL